MSWSREYEKVWSHHSFACKFINLLSQILTLCLTHCLYRCPSIHFLSSLHLCLTHHFTVPTNAYAHTKASSIFYATIFGLSAVDQNIHNMYHTLTLASNYEHSAYIFMLAEKHSHTFFLSPLNIPLFLFSLFEFDCATLAINFPLSFHHSVHRPLHLCLPTLACLIVFVLRSRSH